MKYFLKNRKTIINADRISRVEMLADGTVDIVMASEGRNDDYDQIIHLSGSDADNFYALYLSDALEVEA